MKQLNLFINESLKNDIIDSNGISTYKEVFNKLQAAYENNKKLEKELKPLYKDKPNWDDENWNEWVEKESSICTKYKACGVDPSHRYCGYMSYHHWNKIDENTKQEFKSNTKEWDEIMNTILYWKKYKKDPKIALLKKDDKFVGIIISTGLYNLDFDGQKNGHTGCRYVWKNEPKPYVNGSAYRPGELKSQLSSYDLVVFDEPNDFNADIDYVYLS